MAALLAGAMASPTWAQVELDEAFLRVEINATDGDVGLHGKFDGDAWREMKIKSPDGKTIFTLKVSKGLRSQGLTEDFWESDEPTCQEQSLRDFLARFPPGTYSFEGRTVDGEKVEGEARFTARDSQGPARLGAELLARAVPAMAAPRCCVDGRRRYGKSPSRRLVRARSPDQRSDRR